KKKFPAGRCRFRVDSPGVDLANPARDTIVSLSADNAGELGDEVVRFAPRVQAGRGLQHDVEKSHARLRPWTVQRTAVLANTILTGQPPGPLRRFPCRVGQKPPDGRSLLVALAKALERLKANKPSWQGLQPK